MPDRKTSRRVVHIFGAMDVGGAELRTVELQSKLATEGYEFVYVTLSGRPGELASRIENLGGRVVPVPLNWTFPWRFVRLLSTLRPIAVDSHVATFSGVMCLLSCLARVPVRIAHFHSDGDGHRDSPRRRIQRLLMRALVRRFATAVVGVSPSAIGSGYRADWARFPACTVVPNGTDIEVLWDGRPEPLRESLGLPASSVVLAHLGRPSREKNRSRLPSILRAVVDRGLDAHLVLIGPADVTDDASLLAAAQTHGVAGRIHLLGQRQAVGRCLRGVDVLVQPSLREGLPGAVIEASMVGTPVVSSDVAGARWLAGQLPGIRCLSLDEGDADWAEAVSSAVACPADRMAARRAAEVSHMTLEASASAHRHLYAGRVPPAPRAAHIDGAGSAIAPAVAVTTEAHFSRGPDGVIRTAAANSAYSEWISYQKVAAEVLVVARATDVTNVDGIAVEGPGVRVVPVPGYVGLRGTLASFPTTYRAVRDLARRPQTAYAVRLPSIVGSVLILALWRRQRPYAVEVIGDPFDVLRAGIVPRQLGRAASHAFKRLMQAQCAHASVANYVTARTLQERYPAVNALTVTSASDVDLDEELLVARPRSRPLSARPVLLTVATLSQPYKGLDVLIEACAILDGSSVPVELRIVGSGRLRDELAILAAEVGVAGHTEFLGQLDRADVIAALDDADIFVLPSRTEGLPRALVEAMARGLPAVGSAVGGIPELLDREDVVVPSDPRALAAALRKMIQDPAHLERARARNLARASSYVRSSVQDDWGMYFSSVRNLIGG